MYIAQQILPTLLPALESLSTEVDKYMKDENGTIDNRIKERFNPCVFLAEYFLRNNPKENPNMILPLKYKRFVEAEQFVHFLIKYKQNLFQLINRFKFASISSDQAKLIINTLDDELGFKGKLEKSIKETVCYRITDKITIEKFIEIILESIATQTNIPFPEIEKATIAKWSKKI